MQPPRGLGKAPRDRPWPSSDAGATDATHAWLQRVNRKPVDALCGSAGFRIGQGGAGECARSCSLLLICF